MGGLVRTDAVYFCTDCGVLSHDVPERVCGECGMGVMLSCAPEMLLRSGSAFLVVTSDLRISAASTAVETMLGDVVGESLLDVFSGDPALPRRIGRAAMGSRRVATVALRRGPRRINARIGACGDPPAALVVLG